MDHTLETRRYADGSRGEFGEKNGKNHGPWRTFHANGRPHIDRTFVNGRQHGMSRTWNEDGVLVEEMEYQDDALHGCWRTWNDHGELTRERHFRFGERIESAASTQKSLGAAEQLLIPFKELSSGNAGDHYARALATLALPAVVATPSGQTPTTDRVRSVIGQVTHLPSASSWPVSGGSPLVPLLQIVTAELPHLPEVIKDCAFLAVFGPSQYPVDRSSDQLVVLSANTVDDLRPCESPDGALRRIPSIISWSLTRTEYPDKNAIPPGLRAFIEDHHPESPIFKQTAQSHTKVGGWPSWIQFSGMKGFGDLALQIDSLDFEGWAAGDSTMFYCFRHPRTGLFWSLAEMC